MKKPIIQCLFVVIAYAASPGDIVVNEIMYNSPESGTDNEWVELYNTTAGNIHLDSTWRFSDSEGELIFPDVDIPAGGFLTIKVAENDSVPFPFTPNIDASSHGMLLNNGGDQVIIYENDALIDSVNYDDTWPGSAGHNGGGKSLERIDPFGASNDSSNWNASIADGGTPGTINTVGVKGNGVVPRDFILLSAQPNPFNSAVKIAVSGLRFAVSAPPPTIEIFDINGRMIGWLEEPNTDNRTPKTEYIWQPDKSIGSGVYLVRAKIGCEESTKHIIYLK